jgi:2-polyprenyl-3-methyl-5-hydroxy-6-metoxy-1,4-benzoquinol methylase
MSTAKEHYDNHLADFYSWTAGDFNARVNDNIEFFKTYNIIPFHNKQAIDLGSGHGIQSVALSHLGFNVLAVDFSRQLLDELKQNSKGKVEVLEADIMDFKAYSTYQPELIVCMGDTLTHLKDVNDVKNLINNSYGILCKSGKIVLSFRNFTNELKGTERFIHVKSDDNRILTCFLEYSVNHVNVTDILYEKAGDKWIMKASSYPKLKLSPETVKQILAESNLAVIHEENKNGMDYIIAQKNN